MSRLVPILLLAVMASACDHHPVAPTTPDDGCWRYERDAPLAFTGMIRLSAPHEIRTAPDTAREEFNASWRYGSTADSMYIEPHTMPGVVTRLRRVNFETPIAPGLM